MSALSSARSLAWSGFRAGGLASVVVRPSSRAASGWVAVCSFRSPAAAASFARSWAARLGLAVAVRGRVCVSVPVAPPPSRFPGAGRPVVPAGVAGLARSLAAAGLGRAPRLAVRRAG